MISSAKDTSDPSIGFDHSRNRRRVELINNKNVKSKHYLRIMLYDVFGFAEHREKATSGLGYELTLRRKKDESVIDKGVGIFDARIKIDRIHWYIGQYRSSIPQQIILPLQILIKSTTELRYVERCFFERGKQSEPMELRIG